ncbi:formylglycine-generating enzyme family protein [candidate division CSSED10-310 bacterium]|uniref:Formylglycine-generating enzyme family protein n=1 Tax=candidate division CSSED10-310 bacterium TaxID=2855610 RepID=A0ABV6Z363_UNCC1
MDKKWGIVSLIIVLSIAFIFSCFEEEGLDVSGQIMFSINLTRSMIETNDITHVRLSVYRNSAVVWGPQTCDVDAGSADIAGLPPGDGYSVYVEALDSSGARVCDGWSQTFSLAAGQSITLEPIDLECVSFPGNSGDLYAVDPIVGNMRLVNAGTFVQGSPADEPCRYSDETRFTHTLTRSVAVMETEVTRQMWADLKAVQSSLPSDPTDTNYSSGMSNPAQNMTWYETILFANLLSVRNSLTGCYYTDAGFTTPIDASNYTSGPFYCNFGASGYRLLSEGEWEYAARAGTTTPFSCNETNYTSGNCSSCTAGTHPTLEQYAVYCANDNNQSEAVGSKLPNPWNLKDMHGNVREWCWDWYNSTYPSDTADYTGPGSGSNRVSRGGSWFGNAKICRSADRDYYTPPSHGSLLGFRLVRSVN